LRNRLFRQAIGKRKRARKLDEVATIHRLSVRPGPAAALKKISTRRLLIRLVQRPYPPDARHQSGLFDFLTFRSF
jgi:hypothetical protein